MKKDSGITLIALIITIIVMLILVMVTINLAVKGDLFTYSKKAALDTNRAKTLEQLEAFKMGWEIERKTNDDATIVEYLAEAKTNGDIDDYHMVEEGEYIMEKDGCEVNIQGEKYITFYVYHSSDNTVEEFTRRDDRTFNIVSLVKEGYFYAGYYSDYAGKGSYAGDGVEVIDGTEIAYNGTNASWSIDNAYRENGTVMYPQDETTYYLKEIPKDKFLRHYRLWGSTGGIVGSIFIISAVDDGNYNDVGYFINSKTNRVKFQYFRSSTQISGSSITFTPEYCFGIEGRRSFVY